MLQQRQYGRNRLGYGRFHFWREFIRKIINAGDFDAHNRDVVGQLSAHLAAQGKGSLQRGVVNGRCVPGR